MRTLFAGLMRFSLITAKAAKSHAPPVGPDIDRVTITSGDLSLLLRQGTRWNSGRIDYRKYYLALS